MSFTEITIDGSGLARLAQQLESSGRRIPARIDQILAKAAADTVREAAMKAPYDTGAHSASINAYQEGRGVWSVAATMHYSGYLEFGTRLMPARPHILPAARRAAAELVRVAGATMREETL